MALKVEIIEKIHNNRRLVGYKIRDEKGNEMSIDKDAVKDAIKSGKVEVTNMTVTSDGRILGAAKPSVKKTKKNEIEYRLIEVYTYGNKLVGALVDESEAVDACIIDNHDIKGLGHGLTFETAGVALDRMSNNIYSNISVSGNEVTSDITKVDFDEVVPNMLKILRANEATINESDIGIEFDEDSNEFVINNPVKTDVDDTIRRLIMLLITNRLYTNDFEISATNDEVISVCYNSDAMDKEETIDSLKDIIIEIFK